MSFQSMRPDKLAGGGDHRQHCPRQTTTSATSYPCSSNTGISSWTPVYPSRSPPSGYPQQSQDGGGARNNSMMSCSSPHVPEAISGNGLVYAETQQTSNPQVSGEPHRQHRYERKPWLKPVSSLIRGIPQSKQQQQHHEQRGQLQHHHRHQQQQDWRGQSQGVGDFFPPRYSSIHIRPQRETPHFPTAVWRGDRATAEAAAAGADSIRKIRNEDPGRQQQYDRSRSVSPRIVGGPEVMMFHSGSRTSRTSTEAAEAAAAAAQPSHMAVVSSEAAAVARERHRRLYDLPTPKRHYRSRSLHDHLSIHQSSYDEMLCDDTGGDHHSGGPQVTKSSKNEMHRYFHRHQQVEEEKKQEERFVFRTTNAADSAVAATVVPVLRGAPTPTSSSIPDPFNTPTAVGRPAPFWDEPEPGESPSKQQRKSATSVSSKDPHIRQQHQRQLQLQQCLFPGCSRRHGGIQGKRYTTSYCPDHRTPGMSDTNSGANKTTVITTSAAGSRRNRCLMAGCSKPPRYALPGQKAEYCTLHKMENYVDVKHPRCESEVGCVRQPTFGWEGEKARFCSAHKVDGMLDVKNPRCGEPGCLKRPRYGEEGGRARFCAAHRFDDMVDLASRRSAGGGGGRKQCVSPAKRQRDGPRSAAHDSTAAAAAAAATSASPPGFSMLPFNLGSRIGDAAVTGIVAPLAKRGHTPARAGGHRRATSESWIDFCPKRVFETTDAKDGDVFSTGVVPTPRRSSTARRARHHARRSSNTNVTSVLTAVDPTSNPEGQSVSTATSGGNKVTMNEGDEGEIDGVKHHRRSSIGSSKEMTGTIFFGSGSADRAPPGGDFSGSSAGTATATGTGTAAADTDADTRSVSIAALGGEIANVVAAPISDASPLPSPGSVSSPVSGGARKDKACKSRSMSESAKEEPTPASITSGRTPTLFSGGGGKETASTHTKKADAREATATTTATATVTPQSSSDSIGAGAGGDVGVRGSHFNASDYEASAILLECRSGVLSAEQRI